MLVAPTRPSIKQWQHVAHKGVFSLLEGLQCNCLSSCTNTSKYCTYPQRVQTDGANFHFHGFRNQHSLALLLNTKSFPCYMLYNWTILFSIMCPIVQCLCSINTMNIFRVRPFYGSKQQLIALETRSQEFQHSFIKGWVGLRRTK